MIPINQVITIAIPPPWGVATKWLLLESGISRSDLDIDISLIKYVKIKDKKNRTTKYCIKLNSYYAPFIASRAAS